MVKFGRPEAARAPDRSPERDLDGALSALVGVLMALGEGEVVTYGDVAHDAGFPGRARAVGALLARTDVDVPWWRVVRSDGRLVPPPADRPGGAAARRGRAVRGRPGGRRPPSVGSPESRPDLVAKSRGRTRVGRPASAGGGTGPLIWTKASRMLASASRIVGALGAEAVAEPLDQARHGVDRQRGGHQARAGRPTGGSPPARTAPSRGW